jgi:hypothetical protein
LFIASEREGYVCILEAEIQSPARNAFSVNPNHNNINVIIAYLPSSGLIFCSGSVKPYSVSPACTVAEFIAAAEE